MKLSWIFSGRALIKFSTSCETKSFQYSSKVLASVTFIISLISVGVNFLPKTPYKASEFSFIDCYISFESRLIRSFKPSVVITEFSGVVFPSSSSISVNPVSSNASPDEGTDWTRRESYSSGISSKSPLIISSPTSVPDVSDRCGVAAGLRLIS